MPDTPPSPDPLLSAIAPVQPAPARRAAPAIILAAYACAVFCSAFLLFLVQPVFSRMVLPLLGGSPAVWNTCMLFFQAALLAGYLYAHLTTRWLRPRAQATLHLGLMAAAAIALPVSVADAAPAGGGSPIPWLLLLMTTTVGLPFFVLSGTGPILQRWFSETGHPGAANPYWLYAASNLGSMLALLGYPVLMEPNLRLAAQSHAWTLGYGGLAILLGGCALAVWRARGGEAAAEPPAPIMGRERAVWVGLAFVPSSMLLGVTTYITTDLTPIPLLWVVPLALYLLSFTLVFAPRTLVPHTWMVWAQPALLAAAVMMLLEGWLREPSVAVPIHLGALFVTAMVCHGELSRRRPPASRLTEFYLWISVGGVLGGIFNVLLAPVLFTRIYEYPLLLALACLARPWTETDDDRPRRHILYALQVLAYGIALLYLSSTEDPRLPAIAVVALAAVVITLLTVGLGRAPGWLALCLGGLLLAQVRNEVMSPNNLTTRRTFFGHYRVYVNGIGGGYNVLGHGSTLHGAQSLRPERTAEPLTYYVRNGPLGDIFATNPVGTRGVRVAVVGLGTGTTAAYAQRGEEWTFYEIDPGIVDIARNRDYFTYLHNAEAPIRVVLGDARLSLAKAPKGAYDLILLDAFSSDAVPVHLLTREALGTYLERLAPGGRIAFHVSNRYLDLESVIGELARERGLAVKVGSGPPSKPQRYEQWSTWVVVARAERDLFGLDNPPRWRAPKLRPGARPWTDDYSSVLSVFRG